MSLLMDRQRYLRLYLAKLHKLCVLGIQAVVNTGLIRLVQIRQKMLEVVCDMEGDGGGWIEIANIGETMRKMQIYKDKYQKGYQATNPEGEHIFPVRFDGLDGGEGDLEMLLCDYLWVKFAIISSQFLVNHFVIC